MAGVELYLFTSGTLALGGNEVPVPFYLLRHPQGDVIVDGGNPLAVAHDARAHWGRLADIFEVHMTPAQHCAAQLRELGVAPEATGRVVQTHLHIDHTGALGHFPNAQIVVHAAELQAARTADKPHLQGYVRADYEQPGLDWQPYDGDLDLFGDGSVRLLQSPGTRRATSPCCSSSSTPVPCCSPPTRSTTARNGRVARTRARCTQPSKPAAPASACASSRASSTRCSCSGTIPRTGRSCSTHRTPTVDQPGPSARAREAPPPSSPARTSSHI
jgi:hypothetical protein